MIEALWKFGIAVVAIFFGLPLLCLLAYNITLGQTHNPRYAMAAAVASFLAGVWLFFKSGK